MVAVTLVRSSSQSCIRSCISDILVAEQEQKKILHEKPILIIIKI